MRAVTEGWQQPVPWIAIALAVLVLAIALRAAVLASRRRSRRRAEVELQSSWEMFVRVTDERNGLPIVVALDVLGHLYHRSRALGAAGDELAVAIGHYLDHVVAEGLTSRQDPPVVDRRTPLGLRRG